MLVSQAKLFSRSRRESPAKAVAMSHQWLTRAGYIDQLASGIFSLLPLGHRVNQKIIEIVREEMNRLGALEITLPTLHPASLWAASGRLATMEPPLFRLKDRHDKELVLASTHEEVITDLARKNIESYQDLPTAVYQIQTKFRNEVRATGGLLRVREFQMKDLYSFHRTPTDLQTFYDQVKQAYRTIFSRCDLAVHVVEADSGPIGGTISHEFSVEAATGEDNVVACTSCDFAAKAAATTTPLTACPRCHHPLQTLACIENGHIFQLGTTYSERLGATFTDEDGSKKPLVMGCYGIGIGRLLGAVAETHHDGRGLVWPKAVSPFDYHVVSLQPGVRADAVKVAEELAQSTDVLFDDRDISAGQKFAEADLLGIATRVVISEKTQAQGKIEVTARADGSTKMVHPEQLLKLK